MRKEKEFFKNIFADSPVGMCVYDSSGQCIEANQSVCEIIGATREQILSQNYKKLKSWKDSRLLETANEAVAGKRVTNIRVTFTSTFNKEFTANANFLPFSHEGEDYLLITFDDLSEVKKVEDEREKLIVELKRAVDEIRSLRGILPLCVFCKKIRDDKGYWEQVDIYMKEHMLVDISHGICPDCSQKKYPNMYREILKKETKK